jgi:predicted transcriptional regulator
MTTIGPDIRRWRYQFYLTQEQAAGWLGVSRRSLTGYETGKRVPSDREIHRLNAIMDAFYAGREIGEDVGRPR